MFLTEGHGYPPHPVCIRGCCWFCNAGQRTIQTPDGARLERVFSINRYLDTDDIDVPDVGGVWICESCLGDAAGQVGYRSPLEWAALEAERDALLAEREQLLEDRARLDDLLEGLRWFDQRAAAQGAGPSVVSAGQDPTSTAASDAPARPAPKARAKAKEAADARG